jgi:hypothetical protein
VKHVMVDFWRLCGQMKTMPKIWHTQATEPAYKNGPTDDPSSYRSIGIVPILRGTIDNAFQRYMSRRYQAHSAQHGFRRGVATDQEILRVMNSTRKRAAPLVLLDVKGAYPSVPRRDLVELVRVRVESELANMLSILLAPNRVITIGDPASNVSVTQRGLKQGDLKAPAPFNLFLDPLLEGLEPEQTMEEVVAYADDVTLTPRNSTQLQAQLHYSIIS